MKIKYSFIYVPDGFSNDKALKAVDHRAKNNHPGRIGSALFTVAVLWVMLFFAPGTALAGPPFLTDDPEPVEYKHWEIYLASQYKHDRDQESATFPHVEINYGLIPNVQIHLIAPMQYVKPEGQTSQ